MSGKEWHWRLGLAVACLMTICAEMALRTAWYMPPLWHPLTKQTLYTGVGQASPVTAQRATALWIDDDSQPGVDNVKRICDQLGIKATFAVIPARMEQSVADSLRQWQREGFGIVSHGLHHDHWHQWESQRVLSDIRQSKLVLAQKGFDTLHMAPIVVVPHGANTRAIRQAVRESGCKMVAGAQMANRDIACQQWGRVWITAHTDTAFMHRWLHKAHHEQAFVIFATHSGSSLEFSEAKTLAVLRMAQDMGFKFISNTDY